MRCWILILREQWTLRPCFLVFQNLRKIPITSFSSLIYLILVSWSCFFNLFLLVKVLFRSTFFNTFHFLVNSARTLGRLFLIRLFWSLYYLDLTTIWHSLFAYICRWLSHLPVNYYRLISVCLHVLLLFSVRPWTTMWFWGFSN